MKNVLITLAILMAWPAFSQADLHQAQRYYQHQNWTEAREAYKKVVKENPYNGQYWYRLGYTYLQQKNYAEAVKANRKAAELLAFPSAAWYNLACAESLSGQPEKAMVSLKKAMANGYNDTEWMKKDQDLAALRDHPDFIKITEHAAVSYQNREKGWLSDLQVLTEILMERHYNPFHTLTKEEWDYSISKIEKNIPNWSDEEIIMAFTRLVASVEDGHTNLFPYAKNGSQRLPVLPYLYADGIYIQAAQSGYEELLGSRIIQIGSKSIEEIVEASFTYIGSDNHFQKKMMAPWVLQYVPFLQTEGAIGKATEIPITVILKSGTQKQFTLKPSAIQHVHHLPFHMPPDWTYAHQDLEGDLPLFQKHPGDLYWFEYLEKEKLVYFQFNAVMDKEEESIQAFSQRLSSFINEHEVDALVLDIRNNLGGDGFLNRPLIKDLIRNTKINQKGKFFTIIGRQTFSAAMILTAELEQWTATTFVGEPTGSCPNNYGEHNPFHLPYSGLEGSYSSRYFQLGYTSDDHRPWIAPELIAEPNVTDYLKGEDPALRTIMAFLGK